MPSDNIFAELDCSVLPSDEEDVNDSSTGDGNTSTTYTQASTSATGSFKMPTEILNDLSKVNEPVVETIDDQKQVESTLIDMLPYVIKELKKHNKVDVLANFFRLVKENKFPLNNISFLLWCDVVRWFESSDTRGMRYSPECLHFFWVGRKLFGGRFLRFMSGMKNEGEMIKGNGNAFIPDSSRINFACPSLNVLLNVNPLGDELPSTFKPGVMKEMIKYTSENDKSKNSYVLMLDGKKMKRSSDVDLLGCETGETLKDKTNERDRKMEVLNNGIEKLTDVQAETNLVSRTQTNTKVDVFTTLLSLLMLFSTVLKELRPLRLKKVYAMNKLKELGGSEWRKSKYAYAIDLYMTAIWKIDNCIDKCMQILKTICKTGAHLNNVGHLFAEKNVVDLRSQGNLKILKPVDKLTKDSCSLDTSVIKQRSEKWFTDRKEMKVTGSTLYQAIGCDSLKRQKEHFDRVIHDIQPQEVSEAQQSAMKHGTETEIHHLATMCGIVLPFLYPDLLFYEEGYYIRDNVLVSPDGSLRSSDKKPVYAFEGKSPVQKTYVSTLHDRVPVRYITQTMYESRVLATEGTLYLCWTDTSCTLLKVTGANKGIGFAIIRGLCKQFDGDVYLTARSEMHGQEAVKKLNEEGLKPMFHQMDITDTASIDRLKAFLQNTYGGVDVLVNNAGIAYKSDATEPFSELAEVTLATNFWGTLNVCKRLFPLLRPHSRVVNVSSMLSNLVGKNCSDALKTRFLAPDLTMAQVEELMTEFVTSATEGNFVNKGWLQASYGTSKIGVTLMSFVQQKEMNADSREDILVNACCPGYVDTDMSSHKGSKTIDEGADTPLYLAMLPPNVTEPKGQMVSNRKANPWPDHMDKFDFEVSIACII